MGNDKERILELTRTLLVDFFEKCDVRLLLELMAPDILWLGWTENMTAQGKENVLLFYQAAKKGSMIPFHMTGQRYEARELAPGVWLSQGMGDCTADTKNKILLHEYQRCTFIFRRTAGNAPREWEIIYLHQSIAYKGMEADEFMAFEKGLSTYRKLRNFEVGTASKTDREQLLKAVTSLFQGLPEKLQETLVFLSHIQPFSLATARFYQSDFPDKTTLQKEYGVLVPLLFTASPDTYTFHPLLQQILQQRSHRLSSSIRSLMRRKAALWHLQEENWDAAFVEARKMVEKEGDILLEATHRGGLRLLSHYAPDVVLNTARKIPLPVKLNHMDAYLQILLYVVLNLEASEAEEGLETFMADVPASYAYRPYDEIAFWILEGALAVPNLEAMLPSFQNAAAVAQKHLVKLPREYFTVVTRGVCSLLTLYYRRRGCLQENCATLKEIFEACGKAIQDVAVTLWKTILDGEYAYLTGKLDVAASLMGSFLQTDFETPDEQEGGCVAMFLMPRILAFQGKRSTEECRRISNIFRRLTSKAETPLWADNLQIIAAYLCSTAETPLERIQEELDHLVTMPHYPAVEPMRRTTRRQLLLKLGKYSTITFTEETPPPLPADYTSQKNRLYDNIILAAAEDKLGNSKAAMSLIRKTLLEAKADKVILPFAEHREFLGPYLQELAFDPGLGRIAESILSLKMHKLRTEAFQTVLLTKREQAFVKCIVAGKTNREIADKYCLAEVTVKKTMSRIYQKYGVTNRTGLLAALLGR